MVLIQSLSQYLLLFLIFFGQLGRVTLWGHSVPLIDPILVIFVTSLILSTPKSAILPKHSKFFSLFIAYSWLNLALKYWLFHYNPLVPSLYLVRLTCLLLIFVYPFNISTKFMRFLSLIVLANIAFGLFQYFFWPDLTYLKSIGWDDHLNRLVSTYFDPTFTGLLYLLFLIWITQSRQIILSTITFLALSLTYSRSTFLSLATSSGFLFLKTKKIALFLATILLVLLTIIVLPRRAGEGTRLERTSTVNAKISNLQEGISLFLHSPLTGIGYNNIPHQKQSLPNSHSLGGFDSSLLNILVTSGLIGFIIFALGYYQLFASSPLVIQLMLVALLTHSFFANSLFYPFTTILLAIFYQESKSLKYHK